MKKRLLSLGALMLVAMGSFAQGWTRPEVTGSDLVPGDTVFLYNKEAAGFFRGLGEGGSPHWGSRAGVGIAGCDTVIIQKALAENVKEGTDVSADADIPWESEWDGETYIIQNYASHITKPRWDEVWFGLMDFGTIWTDRQNNVNANTNFFWNFTKNDNGSYTISASKKATWIADPDLYASLIVKDVNGNDSIVPVIKGGERLGVDVTNPDFTTQFEGFTKDGVAVELGYEWLIVKKSDFEKIDLTEFTRYNEAMTLKALIDAKKAEFPDIDFSEAEAVYNNTESTIEELQAAKALINKLILDWEASQATPDNPRILSSAIENATFDEIGKFTGWKGTGFGAGGNTSTNAEHFSKNYNTYQDISIDLPVGIYKVGVKGFYRAGGTDNDWNTKDDPTFRHAKLYAVSGEDSLYTAIPAISSYAQESAVGAPNEVQYAGYYLPNSMADFTIYKEAGLIGEVSVLIPVKNNKLRIGLVKNTHITDDWTIVDDFTLEYYGPSLAAYQMWCEQMLESVPATDEIITDETLYNESYKATYEAAIEAAKNAADADAITAAIKGITPALDSLQANIAAYKAYQAKLEEAEKTLENPSLDEDADAVAHLYDYVDSEDEPGDDDRYPNGGAIYIIENCPLTTAEITAETEALTAWIQAANSAISIGGDCTDMLVNPGFSNGGNGWTLGSGCAPAFSWGVAEVFGSSHGHVDISQVVTGAKPGIYSVSVQAFERPAANGSYDGTEESKVYLYMGDLETPVQNITKDVLPEDQAVDGENCYLSNDYLFTSSDGTVSGWVPNGMQGASIAFAAGRYYQECYGIVGEDGIMKIGLTSHGVVPHWVLFDDFKLKYWGKDADAMAQVLEGNIINAQSYLDDHGAEMTAPAATALENAIAEAEKAVESGDYDTMAGVIAGLNAAQLAAKENIAALNDLTSAIDALDIAMMDNETTADETALATAAAVLEKVADEAYLEFTTEELVAVTEEAEVAVQYLEYNAKRLADLERLPELPTDPAKYPFDMAGYLQNGELANEGEFWTLETTAQNKGNLGDAREFWDGSATNCNFSVTQTLYALPAGKYTLEADLANSYNGQSSLGNEGRAHLFADVYSIGGEVTTTSVPVEPQTEDANVFSKYSITFVVPAEQPYQVVTVGIKTIGTMDARWFGYDNFVLTLVEDPVTAIEGVEDNKAVATPVAIYNLAGSRINNISKGINIIKMSDGSVKKVLVK